MPRIDVPFSDTDRIYDLKYCPHCTDREPERLNFIEQHDKPLFTQGVAVTCFRCGLRGPWAKDVMVTGETYEVAASLWNNLPR